MKPSAFLDLAATLSRGKTPAEFRTAVSRAYYALYNAGDSELAQVSSQMLSLQTKRNKADYRLTDPETEEQRVALAAVSQAVRMVQLLERCTTGPKRDTLIQAITDYRLKTSQ